MVSYLNLPEIFYLGVYQPSTGECEGDFDFTEYTSRIWNLKNCNSLVIEHFTDCISSNLNDDFDCILVVPPHQSGKHNSGIQVLSQEIAYKKNLIDATSCLIRHKTIDNLSLGGNRSLETHLQSIKIVNSEVLKGNKLLLIDDVSTTGNSLKACQRLLESAGANSVKSFVLGKTTRDEEDLGFFDWQYEVIKQSIEEEFAYLQEQVDEETYHNHHCIEDEYEAKMQDLSEAFDSGYFSDEDFADFAFGLDQKCKESHLKIDYESDRNREGIGCDYNWQIQALKNLYEFSFN
jgi:hypoxanthine-guanine phosphoribosyltransferase